MGIAMSTINRKNVLGIYYIFSIEKSESTLKIEVPISNFKVTLVIPRKRELLIT